VVDVVAEIAANVWQVPVEVGQTVATGDTIAVMCRGVLSEVRPVAEWNEQSIISAAIGQTDAAHN